MLKEIPFVCCQELFDYYYCYVAKRNDRQSGIIQALIKTVEKQSMTNVQQSVTMNEQSVLIQQLQEETAVSHNLLKN